MGNTSNITNNHVRKHHPTFYDSYKSTSAKSLNAAQHGEQDLSLLASKTLTHKSVLSLCRLQMLLRGKAAMWPASSGNTRGIV